jgi:hypothetical protein
LPVIDHQAAVLDDLDARFGELLRDLVVLDAELEPDRFRFLRKDFVEMLRNVFRAPEDVDHVDITGDVGELPVYGLAEDLFDIGEIHRHRDDVEAGGLEIFRDVKRGLTALRFGLDAQNGNRAGLREKLA